MKLLRASKSIFNKLLHSLRIPVSHHLAVHLQPRLHDILLLLPELEKSLLILLAQVQDIVPYLLSRGRRSQRKEAFRKFLLLHSKMAQEVDYYFVIGNYRRGVS